MKARTALVCMAAALPLGGCQSFFGFNLASGGAHRETVAEVRPAAEPAVAAPHTETGRGFLASGQNGKAIEAFQKALANGETIAPAVNGLGVAYARIGRFDLAQHFFEQAAAAAPQEARYATNLALVRQSIDTARRSQEMLAEAAIAARTDRAPQPVASRSVSVEQPGQIQRLSRGEVRIVTARPQPAPVRSADAAELQRFKPLIRISFVDKGAVAKGADAAGQDALGH